MAAAEIVEVTRCQVAERCQTYLLTHHEHVQLETCTVISTCSTMQFAHNCDHSKNIIAAWRETLDFTFIILWPWPFTFCPHYSTTSSWHGVYICTNVGVDSSSSLLRVEICHKSFVIGWTEQQWDVNTIYQMLEGAGHTRKLLTPHASHGLLLTLWTSTNHLALSPILTITYQIVYT